jgi:hypothetical protein
MSISITTNDVKRKCMIETSDYDSEISALITEMQGALEETILDVHLDNTDDTNLQKTLTLGILELICAEMIDQINRQVGETEEFKAGAISIKAKAIDGERLRREGNARLAPYRKSAFAPAAANVTLDTS